MLPLAPLFLLVFPAALFVAAQGAGDLHGFTFHAGSAGFDPAGTTQETLNQIGKLSVVTLVLDKAIALHQSCPVIASNGQLL